MVRPSFFSYVSRQHLQIDVELHLVSPVQGIVTSVRSFLGLCLFFLCQPGRVLTAKVISLVVQDDGSLSVFSFVLK